MSKEARNALNQIEDSEVNPARPPKRTLEEAQAAAIARGDKWFVWGGQQVFVNQPETA